MGLSALASFKYGCMAEGVAATKRAGNVATER